MNVRVCACGVEGGWGGRWGFLARFGVMPTRSRGLVQSTRSVRQRVNCRHLYTPLDFEYDLACSISRVQVD